MKESESDKDDLIRVTTGSLKLPESITNEEGKKEMNMVVIVVVLLALAFIGLIAFLISTAK